MTCVRNVRIGLLSARFVVEVSGEHLLPVVLGESLEAFINAYTVYDHTHIMKAQY